MFVILALLGVVVLSGYLYFDRYILNAESDLDKKSKQEQTAEILSKEEFKELPEVKELKQQMDNSNSQEAGSKEGDNSDTIPSQKDIEKSLEQKLESLQGEYNSKINGLLAAARKEYTQIQTGQNSGSKTELAQKYLNLADGIEDQCDARVYAAIAYAENELAQYGYESDTPQKAREIYQQQKKERRKQLLSKI
ncbi:MAG: hypothetical protein ACOY35_02245 [Bacillota bacterium]